MRSFPVSRLSGVLATGLLAAATAVSFSGTAAAEWKPTHNVELVVPFAAGGGNDRVARVMAQILQEKDIVDVPITVVNKPGASGAVGLAYLNGHKGDAHYITITSTTALSAHIIGQSPINYTDLTPISLMIVEPIAIGVNKASDIMTMDDLAAKLKADPKALSVTPGAGLGIPNHIAIALALKSKGVKVGELKTVVFESGAEAATAVLGGHVDVVAASVNNVGEFASGVRMLAVSSEERLDTLPDVPTLREQGIDVVFAFNRYVFGPQGLDADQVAYWEAAFDKLKQEPEWQEQLKANAWTSSTLDSAGVNKELDSTYADLKDVLTELGLAK